MIDYVEKFQPYVDEQFTAISKKALLTNNDLEWTGAHTVKVYKVSTAEMNDYDRNGTGNTASRFGEVKSLNATTEEFTLKKDRSFTFVIDKLDTDETAQQLAAASALERQNREVVIPEVDTYVYNVMCTNAGIEPEAIELSKDNIYSEILKASTALDLALVPDTQRMIVVEPYVYSLMKLSKDIILDTDLSDQQRKSGVIGTLDGCEVIKIPAGRLPNDFGFMMVHPSATVAPTKLEDFRIHQDPPGISGALVEGRIVYDAFVLDNKKKGIYYQSVVSV